MNDENSTVILLGRTMLVEYYLEKRFIILEHNSKNLLSVLNKVKQRVHAIDMHDSDYAIACYKKITSVENTIKILHVMSYFHCGYINNFYHNKRDSIDEFFFQSIETLIKDIDHTFLIQ